ncbi:uncharacterized protein G2W53_030366 [Senna tora]|uniref:Retrotransposon Copia-like N-terminal domain-containing protein n=1 Tax=Senna tora TaxID=362788 RepID=A0A834WBJ3_9FABA|nr:uncharacterized protein G2W53_030366 [Senna tora]
MADPRSRSGAGEDDGHSHEEGRTNQERERPRKNGDHRDEERSRKNGDRPWALLNSDQPGMALVVSPLTGSNFLGWSISIKTALEAKGKLIFIDITVQEPSDEEDYWKWRKADSMVKSWIVNSMTKELADSFVFCRTAKELWSQLEERFGASCGPQIYKIQREVATTVQGSDSIVTYYGRLHKWWDQLGRIFPAPRCTCGGCTCGINKKLAERESSNQLLQFLMGLGQKFKTIRTQILNLDPLPSVNKAYAMVTQDEEQLEVSDVSAGDPLEMAAAFKKDEDPRRFRQKDDKKWDKVCSHCQMKGHLKESCFKIVGYPEWFKELKEQRKKAGNKKLVASTSENPLNDEPEKTKDWATLISQIVRQEIQKANEERVNVAYLGDFAGNTLSSLNSRPEWIIDTGATSHICFEKTLLQDLKKLDKPITIHLPNGTSILDLETKKYLAAGRVRGNLYWLRDSNDEFFGKTHNLALNVCSKSDFHWHFSAGTAQFPSCRDVVNIETAQTKQNSDAEASLELDQTDDDEQNDTNEDFLDLQLGNSEHPLCLYKDSTSSVSFNEKALFSF